MAYVLLGFDADSTTGTTAEGSLIEAAYASVSASYARPGAPSNGVGLRVAGNVPSSLNACDCFNAYTTKPTVKTMQFMFKLVGLPNANTAIFTSGTFSLKCTTTGYLQIGTTTGSYQMTVGNWYEIAVTFDGTWAVAYIDGTSDVTAAWTVTASNVIFKVGYNIEYYIDDLFIDTVTVDATTFAGAVMIYLSIASDGGASQGWTGGAGGTTNIWEAVNNVPPVGVADGDATDASQIRNATSGNPLYYYAHTITISSVTTPGTIAGFGYAWCWHGEGIRTGTKTGRIGWNSNPYSAVVDFTYGEDANACGIWPTEWYIVGAECTPGGANGVNPNNESYLTIGKTTETTRAVDVCFVGAYLAHVPGVAATTSWHRVLAPITDSRSRLLSKLGR